MLAAIYNFSRIIEKIMRELKSRKRNDGTGNELAALINLFILR